MDNQKKNKKVNANNNLGFYIKATANTIDHAQRKVSHKVSPRDAERSVIRSKDVEQIKIKKEPLKTMEASPNKETTHQTYRQQDNRKRESTGSVRQEGTITQNVERKTTTVSLKTTEMKHEEVAQRIVSPKKSTIETRPTSNQKLETQSLAKQGNQLKENNNSISKPLNKSEPKSIENSLKTFQGSPSKQASSSKIGLSSDSKQVTSKQMSSSKQNSPSNLKTGVNQPLKSAVSSSKTNDLHQLSKAMHKGEFQQKNNPKQVLQTRVTPKQSQGLTTKVSQAGQSILGSQNVLNSKDDIKNIVRMMERPKYQNLLDNDTKADIIKGLKNQTISAQEVRNLLKSAHFGNKNGVYIKDKNGKILSKRKIKVNGIANKFVGGKQAGSTMVSKGATVGLKGVATIGQATNTAAKGIGAALNAAMQDSESDVVDFPNKGIQMAKNKVKRVASNKAKKVGMKVAKKTTKTTFKIGKKMSSTVVRAVKASLALAKATLIKAAMVIGPTATVFLLPLMLTLLCLTVLLSSFMGSAESLASIDTLFNSVQMDYREKASDALNDLNSKKQGPPGKGQFENITDSEYQSLLATQWKEDVVTQRGASNIDFQAQLSLIQILSGAASYEQKTPLSDFIAIEKYWMDLGIVEKHTTETTSHTYPVSWTAKKSQSVSETATAKTRSEAESQCKNKVLAHATDGYSIKNKGDIIISTIPNKETKPIKDEDGKVTGYEEVIKDYTASCYVTLRLEKKMSKNLTQYTYYLIFENGRLDEYIEATQNAYQNDTTITLGQVSLGSDYMSSSVITDGTAKKNMEAIWGFFKKQGFTEQAIAGMMGNMWTETGGTFSPSTVEAGSGIGHGIVQWSFDRCNQLFRLAQERGVPWDDMGLQLDYLLSELNGWHWQSTAGKVYFNNINEFKTCTDINKTTEAFMLCFEKPRDQGQSYINGRIEHAKDIYNQLKGKEGSKVENVEVKHKISMPTDSMHFGKTYLYEELLSQTFFSNEHGLDHKANKSKLTEFEIDQIRELYSSPELMEDFTVQSGGGANSPGSTGGILEEGGVQIDFGSKYYTFDATGINGSPNVCDAANTVGWPFSNCLGLSYTGQWNKMICSSYGSSRYWEVNFPDDPYPLPPNWDQKLTIDRVPPGPNSYTTNPNRPIAKSIASITYGGVLHIVFVEGVGKDGSVVISECNATRDNQYGFRVRKFPSFQAFLNSYGATLNGMYGP